jgi:hypothetical protein
MNQSGQNLLAVISVPQCLRGFLQIHHQLHSAVRTAFKIRYLQGDRDSALYWSKQCAVLGKMHLKATGALEFAPEPTKRFDTSIQSFSHLAHPSVFRTAFEVAKETLTDLVTHYEDFVTALKMERDFFLDPMVRETLVNECPETDAVLNALQDLRNLASTILHNASVSQA